MPWLSPARPTPLPRVLAAAAVLAGLSPALPALPSEIDVPMEDGRRVARAVRVPRGPVIDGDLGDAVWALGEDGGPLFQHRPLEDAEATERTSFRILYDDDALYIGVWCFDGEPEGIIAREMARDGVFSADDYIEIDIDTFLDRRNGYSFKVNPLGAREDGTISNNGYPNEDWNGIWSAAARITREGWEAEIAIPFKTLSFDPSLERWGFNLLRVIKRKDEHGRWNAPLARYNTHNVGIAGTLTGLSGLRQGIGLDIVPYALGKYRHERDSGDDTVDGDAGGHIRYRITPNLQASLSANTDFAETEADVRRINLTRFPLFYPEKREFFLEDAGIFEFGGGQSELLPFFSRRIGLSASGEQVPLLVAGKMTGRIGPYGLGVIDALVDGHDGLGEKNAFAARISRNILEQSSIGAIATIGDPNAEEMNAVGGIDFNYWTTDLFDGEVLEWNVYGLASYTEEEENDENLAFGTEIQFPNDVYSGRAEFYQIDEAFNACLGFVPRRGVRGYEIGFGWRPKPASIPWIRQLGPYYSNENVTDLSNRLDTAFHILTPLWVLFESGDEVYARVQWDFDGPDEDFEIRPDIFVPEGAYWWDEYRAGFSTATKRPIQLGGSYRTGGFYDGKRDGWSGSVSLKPFRHLFLSCACEQNKIWLPGGNFETDVASIRAQINFTPDLVWYNLAQYDTDSEIVGYNSRIAWEFRPGAHAYLVLSQNIERDGRDLTWLESEVTLKANITIRF
ncbi:MAG: carbohydrate binding family 9 domain-containing protein [Planctomycetes bacterium]|nr:carbohydrate binding family 9 domain-containing protein [Planctomycetota bacterium]